MGRLVALLLLFCMPTWGTPVLHVGKWQSVVALEQDLDVKRLLSVIGAVDASSSDGKGGFWGNGVFVAPRYFLTAQHVIDQAKCKDIQVRTLVSGRAHLGGRLNKSRQGVRVSCVDVVVSDEKLDMALIEISPPVADYLNEDAGGFKHDTPYVSLGYLASGYVSLVKNVRELGDVSSAGPASGDSCQGGTCPLSQPQCGPQGCPLQGGTSASGQSCPPSGCGGSHCSLDQGGWFDGYAEKGLSGSPLLTVSGDRVQVAGVLSGILAQRSGATMRCSDGDQVAMIPDSFLRPPLQFVSVHELLEKHPDVLQDLKRSRDEFKRSAP